MTNLIITDIDNYDEETAAITLEIAGAVVTAFCHSSQYQVGDKVINHLYATDGDVKVAYLSDWSAEQIKEKAQEQLTKTGYYSYLGCGKVVDFANGIIEVNGFRIEFDELAYDGIVEFEIGRLVLYPNNLKM